MKKFISLLLVIALLIPLLQGCVSTKKPLNVIIVWHNHQPFYKDPLTNEYILPWVRLHGAKDYYRMPYIVSQFPDLHITFDLSGSLISQIIDYQNGLIDENLKLSKVNPQDLSTAQKIKILSIPGGFFDINWDHIVKKVPLFNDILEKRNAAFKDSPNNPEIAVQKLTPQDYLNLQTLFNLFWLDIDFIKNDKDLSPLLDKAFNKVDFTISDRDLVLRKQMEVIDKIFGIYKDLSTKNQIELVSTPYAHPISPLLVDFGLSGELLKQLDKSNEVFYKVFGFYPKGIWASECAINDETLKLFSEKGLKWTISDVDNLPQLGVNKDDPLEKYVPYEINGVAVFFRDKYLSDGIGFRYSGQSVNEAVSDVENTLRNIQSLNKNGSLVYTIALDGENAWEYYNNDGNDFLKAFYSKLSSLQKEGVIKVVTPSEYLSKFKPKSVSPHTVTVLDLSNKDISNINSYSNLPTKEVQGYFGESSWINPTLDTWIGEPQENVAWTWLIDAYKTFNESKNSLSEENLNKANDFLLIAEGSDWFWWYGSDQSSGNDRGFDRLYKLYLGGLYKTLGKQIPDYLFGNFFPDGEPYSMSEVSLKENEPKSIDIPAQNIKASINFDGKNISISLPSKDYIVAVYYGKTLNTFLREQKRPIDFSIDYFPFDKDSIGMPVDFESYFVNGKAIIDTTNLNLDKLYISLVSVKDGKLVSFTEPLRIKLPVKISGALVGELYDEANDDNGPGTYTYPLNDVFKNRGHLFDLISFKMFDNGENYLLQYEMGSIGGNPWNGPNGFSFQIIETYFDVKDGGKTVTIDPKGPKVNIDQNHPWDLAIRVAGWSYGNFIMDASDNVYQGELGISVDNEKNIINVILPKKYLNISSSYKPYITILSGSQDGYGEGYFRAVQQTASEWASGGGDPEAINEGILPKVFDIFVPRGMTQKDILTSYDVKNKTFATVPMLPLSTALKTPNLIGTYELNLPKITPPLTEFEVSIDIKNNGKGPQKDLEGDELVLKLPKYVDFISAESSKGKVSFANSIVSFNGSLESGETVKLKLRMKLSKDVPNAYKEVFIGTLNYDGDGVQKNTSKNEFEFYFFTSYKVEVNLPFEANYLLRNKEKIPFTNKNIVTHYDEKIKDYTTSLEDLSKALGIDYSFDGKKLTLVFFENKYEHWVGQNKSLLNGSAVPLVEGNSSIVSYVENGNIVFPLTALAKSFGFKYNIDNGNKTVNITYLP